MRHKADRARPMGFHVLGFCSELAVWTCEQKVVRDEFLQGGQVRVQLSGSDAGLEENNLWVGRADQHLLECGSIHIIHEHCLV
jgi:hypothetical protein